MSTARIYWPPTREHPSGRLGIIARAFRRTDRCKSATLSPDDPEEYELDCDRPAGHGGRHYAWQWESDDEVLGLPLPYIVAVWGDDVYAKKRHNARCQTVCEHCGCCEHTPATHHCEGRPGCAWNTCGCGLS